jgi:hypothetical protein
VTQFDRLTELREQRRPSHCRRFQSYIQSDLKLAVNDRLEAAGCGWISCLEGKDTASPGMQHLLGNLLEAVTVASHDWRSVSPVRPLVLWLLARGLPCLVGEA